MTSFLFWLLQNIQKTITLISSIEEKIKNFDLNFTELSVFFQNENDNKNENILYDRLLYMNLLDENTWYTIIIS